jgi:hypothetical protein
MKTWKREGQLRIKCPKTKVCNLKERRNNEIPGSNIGKSLKKLKLDERVSLKNGILFPKLFQSCSSDGEIFVKFEAEGREFSKCLRSLEKFISTVKGQYNF